MKKVNSGNIRAYFLLRCNYFNFRNCVSCFVNSCCSVHGGFKMIRFIFKAGILASVNNLHNTEQELNNWQKRWIVVINNVGLYLNNNLVSVIYSLLIKVKQPKAIRFLLRAGTRLSDECLHLWRNVWQIFKDEFLDTYILQTNKKFQLQVLFVSRRTVSSCREIYLIVSTH